MQIWGFEFVKQGFVRFITGPFGSSMGEMDPDVEAFQPFGMWGFRGSWLFEGFGP